MKKTAPARSLSLLGLIGLLIAAPMILFGVVLGHLNKRENKVRSIEYVLIPPADSNTGSPE